MVFSKPHVPSPMSEPPTPSLQTFEPRIPLPPTPPPSTLAPDQHVRVLTSLSHKLMDPVSNEITPKTLKVSCAKIAQMVKLFWETYVKFGKNMVNVIRCIIYIYRNYLRHTSILQE